jgi:tRNA-specific 2-thiouridylase
MSGGVDSSVAAALLLGAGYDVIGLTMRLHRDADPGRGPAAVEAARESAAVLKIPHHVIDLRRPFESRVVRYFCEEYGRGRTPNPCVRCNRVIKFGLLRRRAASLGAGLLATGHYARIGTGRAGRGLVLKKGRDKAKDQTYFLYLLGQDDLAHTLFPLGGLTKAEVRKIAKAKGLPAAGGEESQEICFVPGNDHAGFLGSRVPKAVKPGPILGPDGRVIGMHGGIARYTVGQRRGLGIAAAAPLYVLAVDASRNAVVAGPAAGLARTSLLAEDVNWISGSAPARPVRCRARLRSKHAEAPAVVSPDSGGRAAVVFLEPQRAVAPGQAVVFYRGDEVLGGGTIAAVPD